MNVFSSRPPATERSSRRIPSNVAMILGHPIHPLLIPYLTAFLTAVVATGIAARVTGDRSGGARPRCWRAPASSRASLRAR